MSVIKPSTNYLHIEDSELTPEMLYDFACCDSNQRKKVQITFYLDKFYYVICEKLQDYVGLEKSDLARALVCIGVIILAKAHNLLEGQVKQMIYESCHDRSKYSQNKLRKTMDEIRFVRNYPVAVKKLEALVSKYGSNRYNLLLASELNISPIAHKAVMPEISEKVKNICAEMLNHTLSENNIFANNGKDSEKCRFQIRIPLHAKLIAKVFREQVRDFQDTNSTCFRGAFLLGLSNLARWIVQNKLQETEEFCLNKMIEEIQFITTDYYLEKNNQIT